MKWARCILLVIPLLLVMTLLTIQRPDAGERKSTPNKAAQAEFKKSEPQTQESNFMAKWLSDVINVIKVRFLKPSPRTV